MAIYVERRIEERSGTSLAAAIAIHLVLFALLLTVKLANDPPIETGGPALQLVSFPQAGSQKPITGAGSGSVEAEIPMPTETPAPTGRVDLADIPAPIVKPVEAVPEDEYGGYSVTREAELMFPDLISPPPYPVVLERKGVEGDLRLRLDIDAEGRVTGGTPIGSHHRGFLDSTVEHIKARWRFRPKLIEGRPVASRRTFMIQFRIVKCGNEYCQKVGTFAD